MLNAADLPATELPSIIDYVDPSVAHKMAHGKMNTESSRLQENIAASIRRGHPQMRTGPVQHARVCVVGSGPSLNETEGELRQLLWDGAILVTLNGAYHWCRERNLKPQTQVVMDARPGNARFVTPYVPKCNYVLASQCDPAVWDAVSEYPDVWIWHAVVKAEGETSKILDAYYGGNWVGIGGGTSVVTRAINLLRVAGYVRMDLFGIDCCWMGDAHHAMPQPENSHDTPTEVEVGVHGRGDKKVFTVSPWHVKQFEDCLTIMHVNGRHFQLEVHGSGLLAHALRVLGGDSMENLEVNQKE